MNLGRYNLSPMGRWAVLLLAYSCILYGSHWLAFQLRFDFAIPAATQSQYAWNWLWETPFKLLLLLLFGQFAGLLSYFSIPDLRRIVMALGLFALLAWGVRYTSIPYPDSPRSVVLMDWVLSVVGITAFRLFLRSVRNYSVKTEGVPGGHRRRVGILGAGNVGANLARALAMKPGLRMEPVVFFDDDPSKWRSRVHGIPVVGAPEILEEGDRDFQLEEVIIAMPSAPPRRMAEVIRLLQKVRLEFETVPSVDQLATGKVRVSKLRPVEIQDLLGRNPVSLETESIRSLLQNRVVMVTGAGGSIGTELCRQIALFNPQRLLMVEQAEGSLFQAEQDLVEQGFGGIILPLVADILDARRMGAILARFHPEVIFHAAAHKHVPMMESQPSEAIKNNTLGTARLAELAAEHQVRRFVMISTDKAINPTSVMGATKRLAEIFVQSLHATHPEGTKFMAVRFGNVLGSSGSVIPIFQKQIEAGGPVRVTHPEVTRYFMTIPEAVGLVLQSATQGAGGEIFVLDMGKPVKIADLARQMIELCGLQPEEDIEIQYVGLRPGEKLFEELSYEGENYTPTQHPKIMRFQCQPMPLADVRTILADLTAQLNDAEPVHLKLALKRVVPEYQPFLT